MLAVRCLYQKENTKVSVNHSRSKLLSVVINGGVMKVLFYILRIHTMDCVLMLVAEQGYEETFSCGGDRSTHEKNCCQKCQQHSFVTE